MSAPPPTEADLVALAERALDGAGPGAQATAAWEWSPGEEARISVEVVVVREGRAGIGPTVEAAERAAADGPEALIELPEPSQGRAHQGYDPAVLRLEPERGRRAGASKVAVVSAQGGRAYEQRSFVALERDGIGVTATGPAGLDVAGLEAAAAALGGEAAEADPPQGELPVVLGPDALAAVLDALRPLLGQAGALASGTRVVAPCINLSDSPRFGGTLPRSYDVHGVPRQPVPLIQDGVAHRLVSPATGHAIRPGEPAAEPRNLVLVGGGAADEEELMAPIERGVYLPTGSRAFEIAAGRRGRPLAIRTLEIDPVAVLASTQALSARQRTIPGTGGARTIGATVAPALRATAGVRVG